MVFLLSNGSMESKIVIYSTRPKSRSGLLIPLVWSKIRAGFPSPAEDYVESGLDLNEFLIQRPSSTFIVRVEGHSMILAGIFHGDHLIVDRSIEAAHGNIILAVVNGEFTVKRLVKNSQGISLLAESRNFSTIRITEGMEFEVWGVVTSVIHKTL